MTTEKYGRYLYLLRAHIATRHSASKVYQYSPTAMFLIDEEYNNPLCLECGEAIAVDGITCQEMETVALAQAERRSSTGYATQSLANQPDAIRWTHAYNEQGALGAVDLDNDALLEWAAPPPVQTVPWASSSTHQENEPAPLFVLLIEPADADAPGGYRDGMALKVCISDGMCYPVTLNGPSMRLSDGSILTVRAGEWGGHVEAIITGKEVENGEEAQDAPGRIAWRSRREHRQAEADHGGEGAEDV